MCFSSLLDIAHGYGFNSRDSTTQITKGTKYKDKLFATDEPFKKCECVCFTLGLLAIPESLINLSCLFRYTGKQAYYTFRTIFPSSDLLFCIAKKSKQKCLVRVILLLLTHFAKMSRKLATLKQCSTSKLNFVLRFTQNPKGRGKLKD